MGFLRVRIGNDALKATLSDMVEKGVSRHGYITVAFLPNSAYAIQSTKRFGTGASPDGLVWRTFTPNGHGDLFAANNPAGWNSDSRFDNVLGVIYGEKDIVGKDSFGNPIYKSGKLTEGEIEFLFRQAENREILQSFEGIRLKGNNIIIQGERRGRKPKESFYYAPTDLTYRKKEIVENALFADPTLYKSGDKSRLYSMFPDMRKPMLRRIANEWYAKLGKEP
jgi:hypothetical protein